MSNNYSHDSLVAAIGYAGDAMGVGGETFIQSSGIKEFQDKVANGEDTALDKSSLKRKRAKKGTDLFF